jgi:hypothetical protein
MSDRASFPLLAVVLAGLLASAAGGYQRAKSRYGRPLHWPVRMIDVELKRLPPSLAGPRARDVLAHAVARWRSVDGCRVPLLVFPRPDEDLGPSLGTITIDTPDPWPRKPSESAWTDVVSHPDTGAIERVTILLNPTVVWDTADPVAPDRVDFGSVITHELGHALGLAHSFDRRALMRAGMRPGDRRRELTDDDIAGVCAVFSDTR